MKNKNKNKNKNENKNKNKYSLGIMIPTLEKYGGAERYLIETVRHWQDRYDITIYSVSFDKDLLVEHGVDENVKLVSLSNFYGSDDEFSLLKNTTILTKIWRTEIGIHDVYIGHLWPMHFTELKPFVWVTHEPLRIMHDLKHEQTLSKGDVGLVKNFHLYPKYNYDKLHTAHDISLDIIDKLDRTFSPEVIIANSKYTALNLSEIYHSKATNYAIAYPGVDYESFIQDFPFDKNLFVTIGQLWSHKRHHILLEAISLTIDTQLIIIGSGPEKDRLNNIADKLGISDRVFILSDLSNEDVTLILARACGFLFSPYKEPFGIVVLEAMAAEKPIIAVDEGGFVEALSPEYSFILKPFPHAFAEKITFLQHNPEQAKAMGKLARKASSKFTWHQSSLDIEKAVIGVIKKNNEAQKKTQLSTQLKTESKKGIIGIQYFLWYGDGIGSEHWNDNENLGIVSEHPLLGYYSSLKGNTINYHLDLFSEMNIDFVTLNLHIDENSANEIELHSILNFIDILTERNLKIKFALQLCIYTSNHTLIKETLEFIDKNIMTHQNYLIQNEQNILFWFWSGAFDRNKNFINQLKEISSNYVNIGFSNRIISRNETDLTFDFFDGFAPFSPLDMSSPEKWEEIWKESYHLQKVKMEYKIVTVSPGYDDLLCSDSQRSSNPFRVVERHDGDTYKKTWKFIDKIKISPDIVMISTFNEFHENTFIEPTNKYMNKYIDITKEQIKKYKKS